MNLFPEEVARIIPPLYSQDGSRDPVVYLKLFLPGTEWIWYITEASSIGESGDSHSLNSIRGAVTSRRLDINQVLMFGYVVSGLDPHFSEWGYVDLQELEEIKHPLLSVTVERDLHFGPTPKSQIPDIP